MSCLAHVPVPLLDAVDGATARRAARRQRVLGIVLVLSIIALDQGTKAWAWRHAPTADINIGSTYGMGGPVNQWFSGPVTGAFLDFVDFGVLSLSGFVLIRTRRRSTLFVSATVMIAGWGSNLLDRLGMHTVTAPGSVRGAVDFIPVGHYHCNVADLFIVGATIAFLALVARPRTRRGSLGSRAMRPRTPFPGDRRLRTARSRGVQSATVGLTIAVALIVDVSIGAAHYGRVRHSSASMSHRDEIRMPAEIRAQLSATGRSDSHDLITSPCDDRSSSQCGGLAHAGL